MIEHASEHMRAGHDLQREEFKPTLDREMHRRGRGARGGRNSGIVPLGPTARELRARRRFGLVVTLSLVLLLISGGYFVHGYEITLLRIMSGALLAPFAFRWRSRTSQSSSMDEFQAREVGLFVDFLFGFAVFLVPSTLFHGDIGQLIIQALGGAVLLIIVTALARDHGQTLGRLLPPLFGVTLAASIGLGIVVPRMALVQGRLRGLFWNANLLGFYAFLALAVAMLSVRRRVLFAGLASLSVVSIIWSGSRTSAISGMVLAILLALTHNRRAKVLVFGLVVAAVLALADAFTLRSGMGLFRSLTTRSGSWNETQRALGVSPVFGVGYSGLRAEVASTPLRALAMGGVIGLAGVVVMYLVLIRAAWRSGPSATALCLAGIVHSLAEGWFLSTIGPMLLAYVAVWVGTSPEAHGRGRAGP